MNHNDTCKQNEPCIEGKLLAHFTAIISLTRALAISGHLNRDLFHAELDQGLNWLREHSEIHAAQSFEELLPMLRDV